MIGRTGSSWHREVAGRALLGQLELALLGVDESPGAGQAAGGADLRVVLEDQQVVARPLAAHHPREDLGGLVHGGQGVARGVEAVGVLVEAGAEGPDVAGAVQGADVAVGAAEGLRGLPDRGLEVAELRDVDPAVLHDLVQAADAVGHRADAVVGDHVEGGGEHLDALEVVTDEGGVGPGAPPEAGGGVGGGGGRGGQVVDGGLAGVDVVGVQGGLEAVDGRLGAGEVALDLVGLPGGDADGDQDQDAQGEQDPSAREHGRSVPCRGVVAKLFGVGGVGGSARGFRDGRCATSSTNVRDGRCATCSTFDGKAEPPPGWCRGAVLIRCWKSADADELDGLRPLVGLVAVGDVLDDHLVLARRNSLPEVIVFGRPR